MFIFIALRHCYFNISTCSLREFNFSIAKNELTFIIATGFGLYSAQ